MKKLEEKMSKIRVLVNISIVCIILLIAVYIPNIVSLYMQKSLEDKISYVDVEVKTYEVKYNNIWEKIVNIMKCVEEVGEIKTIPIATEVTEDLKNNLTQQVKQQFSILQEGIICEIPVISKENMISCNKYAIYSSNEANGISFWILKYQTEEETIQLVMDTEFNGIYRFEVLLKSNTGEDALKKYLKWVKLNGYDTTYYEVLEAWIRNISGYFNISSGKIIHVSPNVENHLLNYTLFLSCYLSYSDETDYMDMDGTNSMSTESVSVYEKYSNKKIISENNLFICEYQWNEEGMTLNWGFPFFNNMIQL